MDFKIVIPARYQSSRLPGKPLADLGGRPMLLRVWDRCVAAVGAERVCVATDDERIKKVCERAGVETVITSTRCLTGTDRVASLLDCLSVSHFVNVQGDEPLLSPEDINSVIRFSQEHPHSVINAMCPIKDDTEFRSYSVPKVAVSPDGSLLYMSRSPIPGNKENAFAGAFKQVCIYVFPRPALVSYASAPGRTPLEEIEDIEILRFLELGHRVHMVQVTGGSFAVDTQADLEKMQKIFC